MSWEVKVELRDWNDAQWSESVSVTFDVEFTSSDCEDFETPIREIVDGEGKRIEYLALSTYDIKEVHRKVRDWVVEHIGEILADRAEAQGDAAYEAWVDAQCDERGE